MVEKRRKKDKGIPIPETVVIVGLVATIIYFFNNPKVFLSWLAVIVFLGAGFGIWYYRNK